MNGIHKEVLHLVVNELQLYNNFSHQDNTLLVVIGDLSRFNGHKLFLRT